MTFLAKKLSCAVMLLMMLSGINNTQAQEITFSVTYSSHGNTQSVTREQPTRLAELLNATVFKQSQDTLLSLYWPGSRLSSDKLQQRLIQQRSELVSDLTQLASFWRKRGRVDIERSVNYLVRELEQVNLKAGYKFALEPDLIRVRLQQNPLLSRVEGSRYELLLPTNVASMTDWGLPTSDPYADTQWQWQIALNGSVKKNPIGLSNRHTNAFCYAHDEASPLQLKKPELCEPTRSMDVGTVFTGLSEQVLPAQWQSVNRRIAEIVKHRIK